MSQGAIFKLVLRDERYDKFFTASDYLHKRITTIQAKRCAAGEENIQPTFADLEKTHNLYVHTSYKPYVSIASEYTRVKSDGITFAGGTCHFTFPIYGHFTSDMALHIKFKPIGAAAAMAAGALPSAGTPLLRYCAYPGLRILKRVKFILKDYPQ